MLIWKENSRLQRLLLHQYIGIGVAARGHTNLQPDVFLARLLKLQTARVTVLECATQLGDISTFCQWWYPYHLELDIRVAAKYTLHTTISIYTTDIQYLPRQPMIG